MKHQRDMSELQEIFLPCEIIHRLMCISLLNIYDVFRLATTSRQWNTVLYNSVKEMGVHLFTNGKDMDSIIIKKEYLSLFPNLRRMTLTTQFQMLRVPERIYNNLTSLNIGSYPLKNILLQCTNLTTLTTEEYHPVITQLTHLTALTIKKQYPIDITTDLCKLNNLTFLSHIQTRGSYEFLGKLTKLKHLHLPRCVQNKMDAMTNLRNLSSLMLKTFTIPVLSFDARYMTSLKYLSLTNIITTDLKSLKNMVRLQKTYLKEEDLLAIDGMKNLTHLSIWDFDKNIIHSELLKKLNSRSDLKIFKCNGNAISSIDTRYFPNIRASVFMKFSEFVSDPLEEFDQVIMMNNNHNKAPRFMTGNPIM